MSESATTHYQERAERLQLGEVPDALSGKIIPLLWERELSLQLPHVPSLELAAERYGNLLGTVVDFVIRAEALRRPDYRIGDPSTEMKKRLKRANDLHTATIVEKHLFPSWLKAGKVRNIEIEAIASNEIDQALVHRASQGYHDRSSSAETEAFFVTSAELISGGRMLGRVACLSVVAASRQFDRGNYIPALMPVYYGTAFRQNELLAESGLWQSRATRNYIDMWGIDSAIVQPVRRGRRPRGSKGDA